MIDYLNVIINLIISQSPLQAKKLKKQYEKADNLYKERANYFFTHYTHFLDSIGKDLNYSISCYLNMCSDMTIERIRFDENDEYSSKAFIDVERKIYNNPEIMDYHMHGLALAQFLWDDQYKRFSFFSDNLKNYNSDIKQYLEIGAGHSLYILEATRQLPNDKVSFDLVDVSQTSIDISKKVLDGKPINFIKYDIFDFNPAKRYDFITIGEVLEHVEQPLQLLKKLLRLLNDDGFIYITTPVNSPMIDHIYLFRNVDEIKSMISEAGFEIINDLKVITQDVPEKVAEEKKITIMYAAFLKKNH